jgi:cytochrome c-type biogenesis protein CcmH/NrfG
MTEDIAWINVLAGIGLGLAAGLLVPLLARNWSQRLLLAGSGRARRSSLLAVGILGIVSASVLVSGQRDRVVADVEALPAAMGAATGASAAADGSGATTTAGSMEVAIAELGARLATGGGSDADWELLAQSYDFLGRASDAALARQHKVPTERSLQDAVAVSVRLLGPGKRGVAPFPASAQGDVAALLVQAEEHRRKREFKQACDVFAVVVQRGGMTADAWADYADAQASVSGKLTGEPARAIAAALAADPKHAKALWLQASLAHEEQRYGDALGTWRQLLAVVPPGSSDARIVTANIDEATRLASN